MTRLEKLRERIERNPRHVRFEDLDRLLRAHGFEARQPRRGGSHYFYSRGAVYVSIPRRTPHLLPRYVKLALTAIDQAVEEGQE